MTRFYRFYHYLAPILIAMLARRLVVRGLHHVPRSGAAILVCNHISYSDPALIIGTVQRQVYFMTKVEMFNDGFMHWVIERAGAFPIRRGRLDRTALRHALAVLEREELLGVYPEGTRSEDTHLGHGRAGVVLLARQSGAPLVPIGITGMEHVFLKGWPWLGRPTLTITFGRPFHLHELSAAQETLSRDELAQRVMQRVADLLPAAYQAR